MPTDPQSAVAIEIFCSYAHKDEALRNELAGHLSPLQRTGKIKHWHCKPRVPRNLKHRLQVCRIT